ncbi:MAG: GNAT family N-acetyltransferase, partial [Balneolaceae bacterium]
MKTIEKIDLEYLKLSDYKELKKLMLRCYPDMQDAAWERKHVEKLTTTFTEGQVVIKIDGEIVACAMSIIIDYKNFEDTHTYIDITGNDTFNTHTPKGDTLYGLDMMVHPDYRGLRLGRRL